MTNDLTAEPTRLIRPVRCHLCNAALHYAGQPEHAPEVRVIVHGSDDEYTLYIHAKCWNERMQPK